MTLLELKSTQQTGRVPVTIIKTKGGIDGSNYQQFQTEIQYTVEAGHAICNQTSASQLIRATMG